MSKQHISFWIKDSNLKESEINMKIIGCNSRSDYIDKAVEFYNGYLHNKNNEEYGSPPLSEHWDITVKKIKTI